MSLSGVSFGSGRTGPEPAARTARPVGDRDCGAPRWRGVGDHRPVGELWRPGACGERRGPVVVRPLLERGAGRLPRLCTCVPGPGTSGRWTTTPLVAGRPSDDRRVRSLGGGDVGRTPRQRVLVASPDEGGPGQRVVSRPCDQCCGLGGAGNAGGDCRTGGIGGVGPGTPLAGAGLGGDRGRLRRPGTGRELSSVAGPCRGPGRASPTVAGERRAGSRPDPTECADDAGRLAGGRRRTSLLGRRAAHGVVRPVCLGRPDRAGAAHPGICHGLHVDDGAAARRRRRGRGRCLDVRADVGRRAARTGSPRHPRAADLHVLASVGGRHRARPFASKAPGSTARRREPGPGGRQ